MKPIRLSTLERSKARLPGEPRPFRPAPTGSIRNLTPPRLGTPRLGPDEITQAAKETELRAILTTAGAFTPSLFAKLLKWEKKL